MGARADRFESGAAEQDDDGERACDRDPCDRAAPVCAPSIHPARMLRGDRTPHVSVV
jgi:hypothetical protein